MVADVFCLLVQIKAVGPIEVLAVLAHICDISWLRWQGLLGVKAQYNASLF